MTKKVEMLAFGAGVIFLAGLPLVTGEYIHSLFLGLLSYVTLASAWALFSGPTRYISLATVAFYGMGAYTVAVLADRLPFGIILIVAGLVGLGVSLLVGLATLRLAGVYFVIFSFGLAELIRQVITWFETTVTHTLGRYIFIEITTAQIYWLLLGLGAITITLRWWIEQSRFGLAVHAIGDDETVARHAGINVTAIKLALFALSSVLITLAGAIQAPRWTYVEPSIVFNPTISFITLVMALLGGPSRLWGPVVGAVPLYFLFEWLSVKFPDQFSIILGLVFIAVVFLVPGGILALIEKWRLHLTQTRGKENSHA